MTYSNSSSDHIPSGSDEDVLATDTDAAASPTLLHSLAPHGSDRDTPPAADAVARPHPAAARSSKSKWPVISIQDLNRLSASEQQKLVADQLLAPPQADAVHFEADPAEVAAATKAAAASNDVTHRDQATSSTRTPGTAQSVLSLYGPGVRIWCDGLGLNSRQNPLIEALAVISMAIYLGWPQVLLVLLVASFYSRVALAINVLIWSTVFLPAWPLYWVPFLNNPFVRTWRMYFRFSLALEDPNIDLSQRYIYAEYPHGVFPLSQMIAISLTESAWPGHVIRSLAASSVFTIPLWRHVMTWLGAAPATVKSFKRMLRRGSVGLVPGGIAEMFLVDDKVERIKIRERRGFIKVAVEEGVPIVPVYHFGNTLLFRWGPKSWERLARRWRVALGFIRGRWGIPLLPLPYRLPLFMVVGTPIPVPKVSPSDAEAFEAAVTHVQGQLMVAMEALYNKYKGMYGWEDRPLVMD